MPVIQQERGVKTIAGLPERWGRRAYAELQAALKKGAQSDEYQSLAALLDAITAAPIPVDATDAQLCVMAERFAGDCARVPLAEFVTYAANGPTRLQTPAERMADICRLRGIEPPKELDEGGAARMLDAAWWRRQLRRAHGRAFEHAALRLGFVSMRTGSYCSNETVARRRQQIDRNTAALKASMVANEKGEQFSLYDLAAKGMGNKSNRKGELMLRMAGCEDVAREMEHVGLFVTLTCPSKFHPVIAKTGTPNPKYQNYTPRQAQEHLNRTWARTRAQNDRDGVMPYGFRIAEPHHDGCPHWHMLVFLPESQAETFAANLGKYALEVDGDEPGAQQNRLKIVRINPKKGTAAGYIAKYVGKNIDDSQGRAYDEEGAVEASAAPACDRVDAWASVWGIRQFQGLGMPPVTVWRELRRVKGEHDAAPDYVRRALTASRRIEGAGPTLDGKPVVLQAANFAEYIRAQGGVNLGRGYLVRIAEHQGIVQAGRYGEVVVSLPHGIYGATAPEVVCESKRYTWTRVAGTGPRSPLNNCTHPDQGAVSLVDLGPCIPAWWVQDLTEIADFDDSDWWGSDEWLATAITLDEELELLEVAAAAAWEMDAKSKAIQAARMGRAA